MPKNCKKDGHVRVQGKPHKKSSGRVVLLQGVKNVRVHFCRLTSIQKIVNIKT